MNCRKVYKSWEIDLLQDRSEYDALMTKYNRHLMETNQFEKAAKVNCFKKCTDDDMSTKIVSAKKLHCTLALPESNGFRFTKVMEIMQQQLIYI